MIIQNVMNIWHCFNYVPTRLSIFSFKIKLVLFQNANIISLELNNEVQ